jgi:hypothetical protein
MSTISSKLLKCTVIIIIHQVRLPKYRNPKANQRSLPLSKEQNHPDRKVLLHNLWQQKKVENNQQSSKCY